MQVLLIGMIAPLLVFGFFDSGVNYWSKEDGGANPDRNKVREDYYRKVWEETQNWFPKNVSPIERELYKNPQDPVLRNLYVKYIEQRTQRSREIGKLLQEHFAYKDNILKALRQYGVQIYYFFSPNCPYCLMSEDTAKTLSQYVRIHKLNVEVANPKIQALMEAFNVRSTPTLVAYIKDKGVLGVWVGAFTWDNLDFYRWLQDVAFRARERRND